MRRTQLPAKSSSEMWTPESATEYANPKPPLSRAPYNTPGTYANNLSVTPGSTPDPYRLGYSHYNPFTNDNVGNNSTYGTRFQEDNAREKSNYQKTLPSHEDNHSQIRFAEDPRHFHHGSGRYSESLAPNGYSFVRPFDKRTPKRFNGQHFSMAIHRKNYEQYTMRPAIPWRATRRDETVPHGTLNYDENAISPYLTGGINVAPSGAPTGRGYLRGM